MNKGIFWGAIALATAAVATGAYWLGSIRAADQQKVVSGSSPAGTPQNSKAGQAPLPTMVDAAQVQLAPIAKSITAVGSLRSDETVIIRPEVSGRVSAIEFREGQPVAKGSTLIRLDQSVQRAELLQADANLALAKSRIERARDLHAKGFISSQAKDEAESNYKVSQAAHELSAARLTKLEIKAPFAGYVGLRMVSVGDYVREGQDMVNLEAIDTLKVDFRIPEIFLKEISVGQALKLTLDAIPNQTFSGQVLAINPLLDANGRSIVVRAAVRNTGKTLRPGMFARVSLVSQQIQEGLTIPEQALIPVGDDVFVFKITANRALRTKVDIGRRTTGFAEIVRGLALGDVVVIAGQPKLRDGSSVKVATLNGKPPVESTKPATPAAEIKKS